MYCRASWCHGTDCQVGKRNQLRASGVGTTGMVRKGGMGNIDELCAGYIDRIY